MRLLALLLALAWAGGCGPVNRPQLVKEVLEADPSFSAVLDKRQELADRIETAKRELHFKRQTTDRKIKELRRELREASQSVREKIERTKAMMEPNRERLALEVSLTSDRLKAARAQRTGVGRSISKLRKAVQDGQADTDQARAARQAQLDDQLREAERLDQELASLKDQLRLLKRKLLLLKL